MTTVDLPRELGDRPHDRALAGAGRSRALVSVVAGPLLLGYLLVATVIALVTAWVPGARFSMAGAFAAACPAWLVAQHVPISIHGAPLGVLPLLPTGLLMALVARAANRAAYRLGCHSPAEARFLVLLIGGGHLVVGVLLAVLVSRAGLDVEAPAAAIGCGLVSATAATIGLIRPCGLFPMLFGAFGGPAGADLVAGGTEFDPESGWGTGASGAEFGDVVAEPDPAVGAADPGRAQVMGAPVPLGAAVSLGVRAGLIGLLTLLAGGLALVIVGLGLNFGAATTMFGRTAPGVASGLGLVLLCVAYLPNAAVAATSLLAGPGFSVGVTSVTMTGLHTGQVPDMPLLAALPSRFALWWPVGFLLPLLAGLLVGWWVRRIDDLPQARLRAVGVAAGVTAVGCFVLAEVAGGRLGSGDLDPVQLPAGLFAVAAFCWIAVPGSAVAWIAGPRPHHRSPAATEVADPTDLQEADPTAESADHSDATDPAGHTDSHQPEHSNDEHPDDEHPDDQYADDEYADDEYAHDEYAHDQYAHDQYAHDEHGSDEYLDDEYGSDEHGSDEHGHDEDEDEDEGEDEDEDEGEGEGGDVADRADESAGASAEARPQPTPSAGSTAVSLTRQGNDMRTATGEPSAKPSPSAGSTAVSGTEPGEEVQPRDDDGPHRKSTPSAGSTAASVAEYGTDYDADFDPDALLDLDPDVDFPAEPDQPRTFSAHLAPHPDHEHPGTRDDHSAG